MKQRQSSRADRLKKQNDKLRKALIAERTFWAHLLFCGDCQLQTLTRLICPDAVGLKQDYQRRISDALKAKRKPPYGY